MVCCVHGASVCSIKTFEGWASSSVENVLGAVMKPCGAFSVACVKGIFKLDGWTDSKSNTWGICVSGIEKENPGNRDWLGGDGPE